MRHFLLNFLIAFFLSTFSLQPVSGENINLSDDNRQNSLPIMSIAIMSNGNENIKNFVVNAPDEGYYYCHFWILATEYDTL